MGMDSAKRTRARRTQAAFPLQPTVRRAALTTWRRLFSIFLFAPASGASGRLSPPVISLAARWRKGFFMPNPGTRRQWVLAVLDRYEGPLVRYAGRLLGDGDSAREAVQHAFLQLCERSAGGFRAAARPPGCFAFAATRPWI